MDSGDVRSQGHLYDFRKEFIDFNKYFSTFYRYKLINK